MPTYQDVNTSARRNRRHYVYELIIVGLCFLIGYSFYRYYRITETAHKPNEIPSLSLQFTEATLKISNAKKLKKNHAYFNQRNYSIYMGIHTKFDFDRKIVLKRKSLKEEMTMSYASSMPIKILSLQQISLTYSMGNMKQTLLYHAQDCTLYRFF